MEAKKKKTTRMQQLQLKLTDGYRVLTGSQRILPEFLIIGAAKCGTTSLYNYLIQHPQILPSSKKRGALFRLLLSQRIELVPLPFSIHF